MLAVQEHAEQRREDEREHDPAAGFVAGAIANLAAAAGSSGSTSVIDAGGYVAAWKARAGAR